METTMRESYGRTSRAATELMERIDAVADDLEAEAAETESLGRLTPRALELLAGTGIINSLLPEEYGGYGLYPGEALPLLERVSYIDGSIGWVNTIFASAGHLMCYFDPDTAKGLLADGLPLFAVSGAPVGRAVPVDGGYRFSGTYAYSSGGLHADFVFCNGFVMDGDTPAEGPSGPLPPTMFMVPRSSVQQKGNWDTLGLRGTGSVDFVVDDVFVPHEHVVALLGSPRAGGNETQGGFPLLIQLMHLGFASGITRRILDDVAHLADRPSSRKGVTSLAVNERFRVEYATHVLSAQAARAYVYSIWSDVDDTLRSGGRLSRRQLTLLRGSNIHLHNVAREVAEWSYRKGGGATLRQGRLQRAIRDTLAGTQHAIVDDAHLINIGHELLGVPEDYVWRGTELVPGSTE